jgi:hypothetical protein
VHRTDGQGLTARVLVRTIMDGSTAVMLLGCGACLGNHKSFINGSILSMIIKKNYVVLHEISNPLFEHVFFSFAFAT